MHGFYFDPHHGNCLRKVARIGPDVYRITGVYGDDERPLTHRPWTAVMRVVERRGEGRRLRVDFAGKPIKRDRFMTAVYRERRLRWVEDGHEWLQLYSHGSQFNCDTRGSCLPPLE